MRLDVRDRLETMPVQENGEGGGGGWENPRGRLG